MPYNHYDVIDQALAGSTNNRDPFVVESWRRCVDSHGLDPMRPNSSNIVSAEKLREHREQSEHLIRIARSGLQTLFRQVAGQNYVLLLADNAGVTIDYFGDPTFEDDLRSAGLYLGSDWSEENAGTCGVGAVIMSGEAGTVHQSDHFNIAHVPLSCTAAPIFDTNGMLSAVLDISLLRSPQPKVSQSLALQLVQTSVRRIELANLMARTRSDWVLRFSSLPEFLDVDPEAGIALDGSGRIIGITNGASKILARASGLNWRNPDKIVGQNLNTFFDLTIDEMPNLTRARPTEERIIFLRNGEALFGHAIAPQSRLLEKSLQKSPTRIALGDDDQIVSGLAEQAERLARSRVPILIEGETGTGKERLARAIHTITGKDRPFVAVNCASIPEMMLEEELFGVSGKNARHGLVEAANGGTLFLDEIGDMSLAVQARLLRLLANETVQPVGSAVSTPVKIKLVSATQRSLVEMVREGAFRSDLYFRLAPATLKLPALRTRNDIGTIATRILREITITHSEHWQLTAAALADLSSRQWPGNIRELRGVLEVAVALSDHAVIDVEDLPAPAFPETDLKQETEDLKTLLDGFNWNLSRVARQLGVDRSTIHRRIKREGLVRPH
ncbi:sigma-54-dependent Fis family transcriptional regulator [Coralliovum pocilloporae]|uniref:sigma-54-dependent Fis family transcriptional regulator n=1 Tax=Coralliovum pocilloporae TaxID=3066369 RepID=UPI003D9C05B5